MKRAIVLGGGGSCGSYELGAWKALAELGIDYQIAVGTSIGAINACLMAQMDLELTKSLWDTITVDQVMAEGINFEPSIRAMLNQMKSVGPFLKKFINSKGADITPLIQLLDRVIDEEKLRKSEVDFGLVTVRTTPMKAIELTRSQIPEGELKHYLLASAACFPAFPMYQIGTNRFVDGGYYDNLPISLAIKMGTEEAIAIDLDCNGTHPSYINQPYITYIHPSWSLGSTLNFKQEMIKRNERLGYLDTMREYGKISGFRYAFVPNTQFPKVSRKFCLRVAGVEAIILGDKKLPILPSKKAPLSEVLERHTRGKKLTYEDIAIRGAEVCAEITGADPSVLNDLEEFHRNLIQKLSVKEEYRYRELFCDLNREGGFAYLSELYGDNPEYLLGCLFQMIKNSRDIGRLKRVATDLPAEFAGALYLDTVRKQ
jgi:NTE family protein